MSEDALRLRARRAPARARTVVGADATALAAPFLVVAALLCVFGFVGLNASSYWIDELFTLFVVDHDGGVGEVVRRSLTDTHPPAYYVLAYGWVHVFGSSETALRSLSALLAVAALWVLMQGLKPALTLPARAFAVALAAGSSFWFDYAQIARSYTLCALISAVLVALALRARRASVEGRAVPLSVSAGLAAAGLVGCFSHFYSFLAVGAVYLFLVLTISQTRFRLLTLATGAVLFALVAVYTRALLAATAQDIHHMWFSNAPGDLLDQGLTALSKIMTGLAGPAVGLLIVLRWRRTRSAAVAAGPDPWLLALCGFVVALVVGAGLAVSFALAPSFGKRNLLLLAPFVWVPVAWLYDAVDPGRTVRLLLAVAAAANLAALPHRFQPRTEDWRASADFIESLPACQGDAEIPVVLPYVFGPSTPFFRQLAERYFFGRYLSRSDRLHAYLPEEIAGSTALPALDRLAAQRVHPGACPVLLWAVHDVKAAQAQALAKALGAKPGVAGRGVVTLRSFYNDRAGWFGLGGHEANAWVITVVPKVDSVDRNFLSIMTELKRSSRTKSSSF